MNEIDKQIEERNWMKYPCYSLEDIIIQHTNMVEARLKWQDVSDHYINLPKKNINNEQEEELVGVLFLANLVTYHEEGLYLMLETNYQVINGKEKIREAKSKVDKFLNYPEEYLVKAVSSKFKKQTNNNMGEELKKFLNKLIVENI